MNPEALRIYLELGYVPAPLSFHEGIRKLPPAHYLLVNERGVRQVRYWDFRCVAPERSWSARPEGGLIDELKALIADAVKIRLMSDVPLGAFLSGGVDSALVVAAMKSAGVEHPKAFTIGFKERAFQRGTGGRAHRRTAGRRTMWSRPSMSTICSGCFPVYVDQFDEPFADSSAFPTLALARLARRHVTVALSGDGADELFGGYHYYSMIGRIRPALRWPGARKRRIRQGCSMLPGRVAGCSRGRSAATGTVGLFNYLRSPAKHSSSLIDPGIAATTSGSQSWFEQFAAGFAVDLSAAETGMRLDAGFTLPDLFLQKVDIATMAFSLEARCPLMDYRLVEWAMRLPLEYKLGRGQTKYLLRKALCTQLPRISSIGPKMGFGVPIASWLRGTLAALGRGARP